MLVLSKATLKVGDKVGYLQHFIRPIEGHSPDLGVVTSVDRYITVDFDGNGGIDDYEQNQLILIND